MHGCSGGVCMVAGGACMVAPEGECVWLLTGGACMVTPKGGMRGCSRGVHGFFGDMHGFFRGACMVFSGGGMRRIRRDTVNERAVRILLECILVFTT